MKNSFFFPWLLALACFLSAMRSMMGADSPNIIFILADDLGYTDIGCYGSQYYETPNIDRLASEGIRFTNYHQCQNCQPSRAAMMSGQYSPRTGVYTVGSIERFDWRSRPLRPVDNVAELALDRTTIAQSLKLAGYSTAIFGKWHLGEDDDHHPSKRGFDEAITSMGRHFDFQTHPKIEVPEGKYLADFLADKAEDYIRRKKDEHFFLFLSHFAVHTPLQAKEDWIEHFKKKAPVGGHNNPVYAGMIASVDDSVGRIMRVIDDLHLSEKTLLIFSSDNGGVGGYERDGVLGGSITDNFPLRSGKGSLYEGGTRVPLIMRWAGKTKPGSQCSVPVINVDLPATFIDLAKAPAPSQKVDGESLFPLLSDPTGGKLKREAIFQHMPGYLGAGNHTWRTTPAGSIQIGDWKLIEFFEDSHLELYNLADDLGEQKNLALTNPGKAEELFSRMKAWRNEIGAKMPTPHTPEPPVQIKPERKGQKGGQGKHGAGKKKAQTQGKIRIL